MTIFGGGEETWKGEVWSGPVSRILCRLRGEDHSSATRVTAVVKQPTRRLSTETGGSNCLPIWSCSAGGLPCRRRSRGTRCALTAPFHPYPIPHRAGPGGIFLLHFPSRRRAWPLASLLPVGVRTFLPLRQARGAILRSAPHGGQQCAGGIRSHGGGRRATPVRKRARRTAQPALRVVKSIHVND